MFEVPGIGVPLDALSVDRVWVDRFMARQPPGEGMGYCHETDVLAAVVRQTIERRYGAISSGSVENIDQVVLKVVPDCNLRCVYPCYEYVDESWRTLPRVMPGAVLTQTGRRVGEYAASRGLGSIDIVLHGGEPLYMRRSEVYYGLALPLLRKTISRVAPSTEVTFSMQTNGTLLRPGILDVLKEQQVSIGVSLDGDKAAHDAYRLTKNGRSGSHRLVMRGLDYLHMPKYAELTRSLLCVINVNANPLVVDDYLYQHAPPGTHYIDYSLPHSNHDKPPSQPTDSARQSETPYADWLLPIFWRSLRREAPHIRLFESIMRLALGRPSNTESVGPDAGGTLVIRSDGSYEQADTLRAAMHERVATGMDVRTHSIEQVAMLLRRQGQLGKKTVAEACAPCPVLDICGGGHVASRYSEARGFDNASVYCKDLGAITREISNTARTFAQRSAAYALNEQGTTRTKRSCC